MTRCTYHSRRCTRPAVAWFESIVNEGEIVYVCAKWLEWAKRSHLHKDTVFHRVKS